MDELADGALIVELPFAGVHWLVREILKEAGDAAVLDPEDAREAVLEEAKGLLAAIPGGRTGRASKSSSDGGLRRTVRPRRPRSAPAARRTARRKARAAA